MVKKHSYLVRTFWTALMFASFALMAAYPLSGGEVNVYTAVFMVILAGTFAPVFKFLPVGVAAFYLLNATPLGRFM